MNIKVWLIVLVMFATVPAHSQSTPVRIQRRQIVNMKLPVPDLEVMDQDGKKMRLYGDLVKDKVVVIGTFYTRCEYVCSGVGRSFSGLQAKLGNRLGKDVLLILLSRDPKFDTPEKLKEWARKHGARKGWTLLTGEEKVMQTLIPFFASDSVGPVEMHSDMVYIGNDAANAWLFAGGLSPAEELLKLVDRVTQTQAGKAGS